MIILHNLIL